MAPEDPFGTPNASTGNLPATTAQTLAHFNEKRPEKGSILRKPWFIGAAVGSVIIIIALAVGLGVGLNKKSNRSSDNSGSPNALNTNGGSSTFSAPVASSSASPIQAAKIDPDTPQSAYTSKTFTDNSEMILVFSDEFNREGRTFADGEDSAWTAEKLHDWQTNQMVYYDPSAITTRNGSLEISLTKEKINGLDFKSGMLSSWSKVCFTGGRVEARVQLPGANNVMGLWPAIYSLGNLARAGYPASIDGVWPYSYDSCDVGTVANQTINGLPISAMNSGSPFENGALSYLPGQRLSRCSCAGENHPGPVHSDGSYVGRGSPEIDILEASITRVGENRGRVLQSAQIAPFNAEWQINNASQHVVIYNQTMTARSSYIGGVNQQTASSETVTDQDAYQLSGLAYSVYGFEYKPGFDNAYITWISDNKATWTLTSDAIGADARTEIAARGVSQEPMYLVMSLGMSPNFGFVDLDHLSFPAVMKIDYVRVYQEKGAVNVGCDPVDFPTMDYIRANQEAYKNANITTWEEATSKKFPKNRLVDQC